MSVVNLKVKYIRPKYQNLKEWMQDSQNFYIGRAGVLFIDGVRFPAKSSIFANPYKITTSETRDTVIKKYRQYILKKIYTETEYQKQFSELKKSVETQGKNLGCWCKPEKCHGDVLLELIEKYTVYTHFEDECKICDVKFNELGGWKCGFCGLPLCVMHNEEKYICKCEDEFISK
jgi:hypothetical protein